MTDSGGYQVLEYGSIEPEPSYIAHFENDIQSDILVPRQANRIWVELLAASKGMLTRL